MRHAAGWPTAHRSDRAGDGSARLSAADVSPLTDVGHEWLLPGLDKMPADAVALFSTNWTFVESFLVGLNHEMARKLLWNGYPTDQRGTYFRHFWDIGSRTDGRSTRTSARSMLGRPRWGTMSRTPTIRSCCSCAAS